MKQPKKVLIYSESAEAKQLAAELKADGVNAIIVTPDPAQFDEKNPDPCDEVICWDAFIVHAYDGKAEIDYRGHKVGDEEAIAANDGEDVTAETAPAAKPKRSRKK